jgi:hypothetical protein
MARDAWAGTERGAALLPWLAYKPYAVCIRYIPSAGLYYSSIIPLLFLYYSSIIPLLFLYCSSIVPLFLSVFAAANPLRLPVRLRPQGTISRRPRRPPAQSARGQAR